MYNKKNSQGRRNIASRNLLALVGVLLVMPFFASLAYLYVTNKNKVDVSDVPNKFTAVGLSNTLSDAVLSGTILYKNFKSDADNKKPAPYIYKYNPSSGEVVKYAGKSFLGYLPMSATTTLVLENNPDGKTKYQFGILYKDSGIITPLESMTAFGIDNLTISSDNLMYAYSYQDTEATSTETGIKSIDNWSLAIHTSFSGDSVVISGATEPQWVDNNTAVIFMKTAGLYRLDLTTNEIKKVFSLDDTDFIVFDDLAINQDSTKIILTTAKLNQINIMSLWRNADSQPVVTQIGKINSEAINYTNPLFSPDGQYYSVVASKISGLTLVNGMLDFNSDMAIETRYVTGAEIVKSTKVEDSTKSGVTLLKWLNK